MASYRFKSKELDAAMRMFFTDEQIDRVIGEKWDQGDRCFLFWGPDYTSICVPRDAIDGDPAYVKGEWNRFPGILSPNDGLWLAQMVDGSYQVLRWCSDQREKPEWLEQNSSWCVPNAFVSAFRSFSAPTIQDDPK